MTNEKPAARELRAKLFPPFVRLWTFTNIHIVAKTVNANIYRTLDSVVAIAIVPAGAMTLVKPLRHVIRTLSAPRTDFQHTRPSVIRSLIDRQSNTRLEAVQHNRHRRYPSGGNARAACVAGVINRTLCRMLTVVKAIASIDRAGIGVIAVVAMDPQFRIADSKQR